MQEKANLIGGRWIKGPHQSENINPSDTSDVIAHYSSATKDDLDFAVEAAQIALCEWSSVTPQVRADLLDRVGQNIFYRKDEIGRLLSREEGKTLREGVAETVRASQIFRWFAGEALRSGGDFTPSVRPDITIEVSREPVGVVGLITPWNFPLAIPAWKVAAALAFGNTVILKPAELTPGCAHVLAQILDEAGCPAGAFNLVMGKGSLIGQAMVEHHNVDAISFTGSEMVGQGLLRDCAQTRKKVQLEMGGKNPTLVMEDADLDHAVQMVIDAAFYSTGQRCTATSRAIVHRQVHDDFVSRMVQAMNDLKVGHALDAETQIGPVASEKQLQDNLGYIELAQTEGAEVLGGKRCERSTKGFYQAPALFLNAHNDMRVAQEEIFGPVLTVITAQDFDHGLALVNDTKFGLAAGICTNSLSYAQEFKRRSQAGMVMVNLPTAGVDYHVPFGGRKNSSYGPREQGSYAREFYTSVKTAYTHASNAGD